MQLLLITEFCCLLLQATLPAPLSHHHQCEASCCRFNYLCPQLRRPKVRHLTASVKCCCLGLWSGQPCQHQPWQW